MKTIPAQIEENLLKQRVPDETPWFYMMCDRTLDGVFCDWIFVATKQHRVHIFKSASQGAKDFRGFVNRTGKKLETYKRDFSAFDLESYSFDEIEEIEITNLVASGMLSFKRNDTESAVCAFTNSRMAEVADFVKYFNKLKKNGKLDDEDLQEEERKEACPKCGMMYPEAGREICPRCTKKSAILIRLLKMAMNYKKEFFCVYALMALTSLFSIAIPYLQGTVLFDQVLKPGTELYGKIGLVVGLMILLRFFSTISSGIAGLVNVRFSAKLIFDLKTTVFACMQKLSLSFFQKKQTGQLMTRVNSDSSELHFFFVDGMTYFFVNFLNIVGITAIMLSINMKLTLFCFIPFIAIIFFIKNQMPKLDRMEWKRWSRRSKLNSIIADTMKGTRVIKAFGKEKTEIKRFGKVNESFYTVETGFNKRVGTIYPIISLLINMGGIIIWAFGGWQTMGNFMELGTLITFSNFIYMLYGPLEGMSNIIGWWSYCMTAAQRIFEIADATPEVRETDNPVHLEKVEGNINVENITFGYEPNKPIIKDTTLQIKAGQMVGIVGHSGAGKSTLVNLISRLYDVNDGRIKIDGVNIKDLASKDLRANIGIVSQDVYVFMGSVAENIAYAKPDCTRQEIIEAAKIANAHNFIEKLPEGYDTLVGMAGQDLSGGEKQRISIARAILRNPKILILDEATASLDTETEKQIQEALETLIIGRTTIAIAHRLSTLRNADFLVVMEHGSIVEQGTHYELIHKKGEYFRLVQKQTDALKIRGIA